MDAVLLPSSFAPIITTTTPMNTTTSSPINTTSTPLPIDIVYPRAGHASCLYNNSIYIIGGRNSSDSSIVDSVEIDLMSNISMTFDPIFTQLQAGSQSFGCSLDGEIYYSAFGKDALISDDIMMYDIDTGNEMFLFKGTVRQPCVAYNSEYNVLYIIGGSDDIQLEMASNIVMECELFNYTCVQMSRLIEARVEHTCQYVNNKLYAIIGTSSSIEYLNDTSGNSSWNILGRMTYPHPITGMRSILVEELIYIIGGENIAGFIGSVLIIDTVNDALISSSINLEIPRTRHSLIYDPDTQLIYVIGGFNGEYLKSVETIKSMEPYIISNILSQYNTCI